MPKVSKKKRFRGQSRWDVARSGSSPEPVSTSSNSNLSSPRVSTPVIETASVRKIRSQSTDRSEVLDGAYSYRLIELSNLVSAFQPLHNCELGGELKVNEDEARMYGSSSVINIECSKCDTNIELQTSGNKNQVWKPQNSMDTNRRMVYSAMEIGVGREGMSVVCDIFNMPSPCHHKAWDSHVAALYKAHKKAVAEQLQQARDKVFSHHSCNESDVPGGEFTLEGCMKKDEKRMSHSVRKTKSKEKERRRKIRQAKLAANQEKEGEPSYASGMFNEVDPLDYVVSSDDDDYSLARLLADDVSEDSDDAPLAQFISKRQQK